MKVSSEAYGSTRGTITQDMLEQAQTLPEQMEQLCVFFYDGSAVGMWGAGQTQHFDAGLLKRKA